MLTRVWSYAHNINPRCDYPAYNGFHTVHAKTFISSQCHVWKKALHLCHSAGPLIAITNPISCFRERKPPACCFWPLTKSQKYENYPSSHGLQLFKSHQRSSLTNLHKAQRPDLTGRTRLYPPPPPTTKPLTSLSLQRNKVTRVCFEPFVRPHNSTTMRPDDYMCAESPDKQHRLPLGLVISFLIHSLACALPPPHSTCHIPLECRTQK